MSSRTVFLDTNGWVALLNQEDSLHRAAVEAWRTLGRGGGRVVLTDWIVAETGNALARTVVRRAFPEAVQRLLRLPQTRLAFVTPTLLERALRLYSDRPDKTWGLVDCASFVVMQDEGLTGAFTTDRHFEQAGFKCLLAEAAS
jgi:uncharacterized protein